MDQFLAGDQKKMGFVFPLHTLFFVSCLHVSHLFLHMCRHNGNRWYTSEISNHFRIHYQWSFNPLSPDDTLKHHFSFLKTDLIFLQLVVLECGFRTSGFSGLPIHDNFIFFNFLPTPNHLHSLQVENCDSNSRLVVNEDDNGKFRPERVNTAKAIARFMLNLLLRCCFYIFISLALLT